MILQASWCMRPSREHPLIDMTSSPTLISPDISAAPPVVEEYSNSALFKDIFYDSQNSFSACHWYFGSACPNHTDKQAALQNKWSNTAKSVQPVVCTVTMKEILGLGLQFYTEHWNVLGRLICVSWFTWTLSLNCVLSRKYIQDVWRLWVCYVVCSEVVNRGQEDFDSGHSPWYFNIQAI